jgi:hypothetical protein
MTRSNVEVGVLGRAVSDASSVHNSQPWSLAARTDAVDLRERFEVVVPRHDRTGRDHLLAGMAMQRVWLTAVTHGLVASVLTKPLHLPDVRAGLIERLQLAGYPQLILRLGYPVTATPAVPEHIGELAEEHLR